MRNKLLAVVVIFSFISTSCRKLSEQSAIDSGRIDYKITYLNPDLDKKTASLLPTRMKLLFNEKHASNNIEGFMGVYKINAFTNFHTRKCSTVLKVFEKYYIFKGARDEQMCCFDTMEGMEIEYTKDTKKIAGFNCKRCIITLPGTSDTIDVYYTDEIRLKHPNSTNPYHEIKGVLMEFELKLLYLNMHFIAEKYEPLQKNNITIKTPENTKNVTREQMTQILSRLME